MTEGDTGVMSRQIRKLGNDLAFREELARRGVERARGFDRDDWLDGAGRIIRSAARATARLP